MCKKLVVALMMLSLASYAYAYLPNEVVYHADFDDTVISSFETGMDGWVVNTGPSNYSALNAALPGTFAYGATDGFYSLQVTTAASWWNEFMSIDLAAIEGGRDVFFGNNTLSLDVSWLQSEWTSQNLAGWGATPSIALLVNPGNTWFHGVWADGNPANGPLNWWNGGSIDVPAGYYDYGIGAPVINPDGTVTLSWNYQDITGGAIKGDTATIKLIFEIVTATYVDPQLMYFDNVKLSGDGYVEYTPEPTTIALLGLGSLALLRRKK